MENCYLDYAEKGYPWHIDTKRVKENETWTNIGYGNDYVITHFCDMVDVMMREFGMKFTTEQIIRLAECTPGITVFYPTPIPEDYDDEQLHGRPIWSRNRIEKHIEWKEVEDE